jgi:hypothetical protein
MNWKVDVNTIVDDEPILNRLIRSGDKMAFNSWLAYGANPNLVGKSKTSALGVCLQWNSDGFDCLSELLKAGADPFLKVENNRPWFFGGFTVA